MKVANIVNKMIHLKWFCIIHSQNNRVSGMVKLSVGPCEERKDRGRSIHWYDDIKKSGRIKLDDSYTAQRELEEQERGLSSVLSASGPIRRRRRRM